jgi:hypothetical protein
MPGQLGEARGGDPHTIKDLRTIIKDLRKIPHHRVANLHRVSWRVQEAGLVPVRLCLQISKFPQAILRVHVNLCCATTYCLLHSKCYSHMVV